MGIFKDFVWLNDETLELTRKENHILRKFKHNNKISCETLKNEDIEDLILYELIEQNPSDEFDEHCRNIPLKEYVLTKKGKRYKLFKLANYKRIWIPIVISTLALFVSIIALFK